MDGKSLHHELYVPKAGCACFRRVQVSGFRFQQELKLAPAFLSDTRNLKPETIYSLIQTSISPGLLFAHMK